MFTERLIGISGEYFIRSGIIPIFMQFHSVVKVNETDKLKVTISAVFKAILVYRMLIRGRICYSALDIPDPLVPSWLSV